MIFDTHAHYDDEAFDADRDALLESLPDKGIGLVVNPGITLETGRMAIAMAARHPHVYAAVGIHPENCHDYDETFLPRLRELARQPKVVAIGEIGLDYYWAENPSREHQVRVLREQLCLAEELGLPVIIHDRDAHGDILSIVREFPGMRGVFHCYAGSAEMARELLDMGWYLGFNGAITFKNARRAPEVIAMAPMERIVVETDAPYLTPVPHRGKRNDSTYLPYVVEAVAAIKKLPPLTVADITWENGKKLFSIA